jgi:glutamate/tyrosine decarboxylase-like PLP-dependent enzyme
MLRERPCWEVVTPATLGIVTFRWRRSEEVNASLAAASLADGFTLVSSTVLRGRSVVRFCPINPRTTEDDMRTSLDRLEILADRIAERTG